MLFRIITIAAVCSVGCSSPISSQPYNLVNAAGNTVQSRFNIPAGYKRVQADDFTLYLRTMPLQPHGATLYLYNKQPKGRQDVHAAILKMDAGTKDLQQCADAVMRLRAEYLYHSGMQDDIHFNFTNGFRADYSKWKQGNRIQVRGNNVAWVKNAESNNSYASFRRYMDVVFTYAGTLSLSKELKNIRFSALKPGDVLIQGGSPGHAVIVVDVAINNMGNKIFMLAQSYMPAQEIHIVHNPRNKSISPWYSTEEIDTIIETPEWDFTINDLKRF